MRYEKGENYDEAIDELVKGLEELEQEDCNLLDQLKVIDQVHECGGYLNKIVYDGVMDASLGSCYDYDKAKSIYRALGEEPLDDWLYKLSSAAEWDEVIERGVWDFKKESLKTSLILTYVNLLTEAIKKKYGCEGKRVSTLSQLIQFSYFVKPKKIKKCVKKNF